MRFLLLSLALLAAGCTPTTPASDASVPDAWDDSCSDEGRYTCTAIGRGSQCCGGHVQSFIDGPCWPQPDAGMADCTTMPNDVGCPCTVEDALSCRGFLRTRCVSGTWTLVPGTSCCL